MRTEGGEQLAGEVISLLRGGEATGRDAKGFLPAWVANLVSGFVAAIRWGMRYPWRRSVVEGRLRAVRISVCPPERYDECVLIYERNEAHGLPSYVRERYRNTLQDGTLQTFLVEEADRVVGSFGLSRAPQLNGIYLCYFMVVPEFHRRSIGTTMFMAALAMFPRADRDLYLLLEAVPRAVSFYRRFGCRIVGGYQMEEDGMLLQIATLEVTSLMRHSCRQWLEEAGASLPDGECDIPGEITR